MSDSDHDNLLPKKQRDHLCEKCESDIWNDDAVEHNDLYYCQDCWEKITERCEECGERVLKAKDAEEGFIGDDPMGDEGFYCFKCCDRCEGCGSAVYKLHPGEKLSEGFGLRNGLCRLCLPGFG